jgi:hydroxymethylcytosylglucuronate/cytosylglucuronate synthase
MRILGSAVDFGWGPTGKLSSIMKALPEAEWYTCGGGTDSPILRDQPITATCEGRDHDTLQRYCREAQIDAAVVVLDPELAATLEEIGVSTVYVDSLPFLWTEKDFVPGRVSAYCAQMCGSLPDHSWSKLREITNLKWVEAIVPPSKTSRTDTRDNRAVVNLGGLHWTTPTPASYACAVLPPVVRGLQGFDFEEIAITGSPTAIESARKALIDAPCHVTFKSLPHSEFLELVSQSSILLSSPGLTTILETSSFRVPTVLLPPQNLSQYTNSRFFSTYTSGRIIGWSDKELLPHRIQKLLPFGEEAVVRFIQEQIDRVSKSKEEGENIENRINDLCSSALVDRSFSSHFHDIFGNDGAAQVAKQIITIARQRR